MCVGIALALTFLVGYYASSALSDMLLYEQVGESKVMIAQGIEMLGELWFVVLLGAMLGIALTLIFLKGKKVL